jgi:hypothetical protein
VQTRLKQLVKQSRAGPCKKGNSRFEYINQQDATVSQVDYLTFMCGSTCLGRLSVHHQECTTALEASGFTVGALLVVVWQVILPDHDQQRSNRHAPTVKPEAPSAVVGS